MTSTSSRLYGPFSLLKRGSSGESGEWEAHRPKKYVSPFDPTKVHHEAGSEEHSQQNAVERRIKSAAPPTQPARRGPGVR